MDEKLLLQMIQEAGNSLALVMIGGVNYYSGQVFDMRAITEAAHAVGAYAGFDLAHAVGNVPLHLHDWEVDFACWCSYKYLNSGPGAVAGVFIHQKHVTDTSLPRMAGWWGYKKETRFKMQPGFQPIPTAEGWQLSNAPVLSMAAHKAALEVFAMAGMEALHEKGRMLTGYLRYLLDGINQKLKMEAIRIITPSRVGAHGCQLSLVLHDRGRVVFDELTSRGVVADWREPNVVRVAPVPLYNSFEDVWHFAAIIEEVLKQKS